MNRLLSTIYGGYRNIKLIAQDSRELADISGSTLIGRGSYMPHLLGTDVSADLLIIDLDAFGIEKTRCLIFLAYCFVPNTPLVIQTENALSASQRDNLMRTGSVLDVIESRDSASFCHACC